MMETKDKPITLIAPTEQSGPRLLQATGSAQDPSARIHRGYPNTRAFCPSASPETAWQPCCGGSVPSQRSHFQQATQLQSHGAEALPRFVNEALGDYRPTAGSAMIDQGQRIDGINSTETPLPNELPTQQEAPVSDENANQEAPASDGNTKQPIYLPNKATHNLARDTVPTIWLLTATGKRRICLDTMISATFIKSSSGDSTIG